MFKTIRNAFKVKELRTKILYTFMMLVVIRFGSQLPSSTLPLSNPLT